MTADQRATANQRNVGSVWPDAVCSLVDRSVDRGGVQIHVLGFVCQPTVTIGRILAPAYAGIATPSAPAFIAPAGRQRTFFLDIRYRCAVSLPASGTTWLRD
jgi:hypothetical protein